MKNFMYKKILSKIQDAIGLTVIEPITKSRIMIQLIFRTSII